MLPLTFATPSTRGSSTYVVLDKCVPNPRTKISVGSAQKEKYHYCINPHNKERYSTSGIFHNKNSSFGNEMQ